MHTYVHFQDWTAGLFVRELVTEWPISRWAAFEGIRPDALMVRHSRDKKRTGHPVLAHLDTPRRLLKELKLGLPAGTAAELLPEPMPVEPDPRSRLERLPLEGIYCLIALAGRSMSHQAREHVTGIDRHTYERLRTAALQVAGAKTATRNREARRPRFLADRKTKRRRPNLSRLPQLDGIAPAIPRERCERDDAREAYRRAFQIDSPVEQMALQSILDRTSHSDPAVVSTTLEDLVSTISVLKKLGIPRERLGLEIRSLPRSAVALDQWVLEVARRTDVPVEAIQSAGIEAPVTRSARTHPAGRIAVRVTQPVQALETSLSTDAPVVPTPHRLAYGWRVGCYYALCVKQSLA
jgi:post-segregation antitoxin (ccd killing protein)